MAAPPRVRPPDVAGGLEVYRSHTGRWLVRLSDGTDPDGPHYAEDELGWAR